MKSQKRGHICVSLLLVGVMCISGNVAATANYEETPVEDEGVSCNLVLDNEPEMPLNVSDNQSVEKSDTLLMEEEGIVSETVSSQLKDEMSGRFSVSGNQHMKGESPKDILSVVFPIEVPCHMVLYEQRAHRGIVVSKQFFIENRGFEDVCISMKGGYEVKKGEDYIFSDTSVDKDFVQGKKNIYLYLKWEDENGEELGYPRMIIGDIVPLNEAEIILKAPKRDDEGEIIGENSDSKVYFSLGGDLNADIGQTWKDDELKLNLSYSVESVMSGNTMSLSVNQRVPERETEIFDCSPIQETQENVSENSTSENSLENMGSLSNNESLSEGSNDEIKEDDIFSVEKDAVEEEGMEDINVISGQLEKNIYEFP